MSKYELINSEGCYFATCEASDFKDAREIFSQNYEGKFIIIEKESSERKNVILK